MYMYVRTYIRVVCVIKPSQGDDDDGGDGDGNGGGYHSREGKTITKRTERFISERQAFSLIKLFR